MHEPASQFVRASKVATRCADCSCIEGPLLFLGLIVVSLPPRRQEPVTAEHVFQWRNMMEFFLIKHFRRCLPLLLKYDAVGEPAALLGLQQIFNTA